MEQASLYKPKIWPQVSRSFDSGWLNTGIFVPRIKWSSSCFRVRSSHVVCGIKMTTNSFKEGERGEKLTVIKKVGISQERILTVLSPCKQKVGLTEVSEAGSHEPSL